MIDLGIVSGLLGLGSDLISNIFNWNMNREANDLTRENNEFQRTAFNQQMAYQRERANVSDSQFQRQQELAEHQQNWQEQSQIHQWQREDTSYQRTKNDLIEAGYSPLAINGTNDAGSIASSVSQPSQSQTPSNPGIPELQAINPFQLQNSAIGSIISAIGNAEERKLKSRELNIQEQKNLTDKEQKEADRAQRIQEHKDNLIITINKMNNDYQNARDELAQNAKKIGLERTKEVNNFIVKMHEINNLEQFRNDKEAYERAERIMKENTEGKGHFKTDFESYEHYLKYKIWYEAKVAEYYNEIAKACRQTSSFSENKSGGGQVSVMDIAGFGGQGSYGYSEKRDPVGEAKNKLYAFYTQNGYPWWFGNEK